MASFNDYNGALEIFKQVDCVGEKDNWIFGGFIDKSKSAKFTSSMIGRHTLGNAGYMAGYEIGRKRDLEISKINDYFSSTQYIVVFITILILLNHLFHNYYDLLNSFYISNI